MLKWSRKSPQGEGATLDSIACRTPTSMWRAMSLELTRLNVDVNALIQRTPNPTDTCPLGIQRSLKDTLKLKCPLGDDWALAEVRGRAPHRQGASARVFCFALKHLNNPPEATLRSQLETGELGLGARVRVIQLSCLLLTPGRFNAKQNTRADAP